MKFLVFALLLVYIISPIDFIPGIPIDDILVAIGAVSFLLKSNDA